MGSGEHLGKVSRDRDIPGLHTTDWETPSTRQDCHLMKTNKKQVAKKTCIIVVIG